MEVMTVSFYKEDDMGMCTVGLIEYGIYTDLMTVGIAHDLASFVAKLVEELRVGLEEVVNPLFGSMRIAVEGPQ